ncbi:MAG TPA: RtcB family protein [Bacteroidales bacterium]|nr:RtcB family protein [Bacteroidales bacterium]
MQKIDSGSKVPIKLWIDEIEESALQQARNVASFPFAFSHVAIMPDAHEGYGMPIGAVLAAKDAIVPNAVGVDIGCGMCAVKTNIKTFQIDQKILKKILSEIRKKIPLGFNHHKSAQDSSLMPKNYDISSMEIVSREYKSALKQLGTLGGGNHFIEIQKDKNDFLWIMIHSGSRNIGLKVAEHYNKKAAKFCEKYNLPVIPKADLSYFPIESKEASEYIREMNYCIEFAFSNRKLMMNRILETFAENFAIFYSGEIINIAHNYASLEEHFGENVYVHRKGATSAKKGETGIIPGSQGTNSYITEGLGNPESFMSCSHGAGRVMSRKKAIKSLDLHKEVKILEEKGIIHSIRCQRDLEEAASAYKNIHEVMNFQKDLVKIKYELSPLAVIKG